MSFVVSVSASHHAAAAAVPRRFASAPRTAGPATASPCATISRRRQLSLRRGAQDRRSPSVVLRAAEDDVQADAEAPPPAAARAAPAEEDDEEVKGAQMTAIVTGACGPVKEKINTMT